jgi:hypothetical protein
MLLDKLCSFFSFHRYLSAHHKLSNSSSGPSNIMCGDYEVAGQKQQIGSAKRSLVELAAKKTEKDVEKHVSR